MIEEIDNRVKLHIGAGKRDFGKGWVNIDAEQLPHIHHHNVLELPFEDNSVDLIYTSHLLEYFDKNEVGAILKEWRRVLKVGGVLRLAVPNFEPIAKLYVEQNLMLENFLGLLYGAMDCNGQKIYHKTVYDFRSLRFLLKHNGFGDVTKWDFRNTEHSEFDDHSKAHYPHNDNNIYTGKFDRSQTLMSLNVECKKIEFPDGERD